MIMPDHCLQFQALLNIRIKLEAWFYQKLWPMILPYCRAQPVTLLILKHTLWPYLNLEHTLWTCLITKWAMCPHMTRESCLQSVWMWSPANCAIQLGRIARGLTQPGTIEEPNSQSCPITEANHCHHPPRNKHCNPAWPEVITKTRQWLYLIMEHSQMPHSK